MCIRDRAKRLKGCYMLLDEASVTGTANIVMAAVLAEGTTTIYNAACEPYLQHASATLCCSPPDSSVGRFLALEASPTRLSI